jgi:DNA modification methylase
MKIEKNTLFYGDNLDILRRYIDDGSIDLIYLDPPWNKKATYNILFAEKNGSDSAAQIKAFEDTWRWDQASSQAYHEVVESGGRVADAMLAFRTLLGDNDMLAYLSMMAPRLVELHRVLKPTGSIYLHCDPTASHYLKMLMDAIFGPANYRNEIVWERATAHNIRTKGYVRANDTILYYSKTTQFVFNEQYTSYGPEQMRRYKPDETGKLYKAENLTFSSANPNRQFEWRGAKPPANRSWGASLEQLEAWYSEGRILLKRDGTPRMDGLKVYLDETKGKPVSSNWTDIPRIANTSAERLGYPTQKPEALLQRIIEASSNEGDLVLDPFCGCGTTIAVAQRLNRPWIGIDITHFAVTLMKHRLHDTFGDQVSYEIIGEPTTLPDAKALAEQDPFQFEVWTLGLVDARPTSKKRGADKGIDGRLYFHDDPKGETKKIILSVKSGHIFPRDVRDLRGVVEREGAEIGVLITLEEPKRAMKSEAASAGFYDSPWGTKHPKVQILTVEELLEEKKIDYPPTRGDATFKKAPKAEGEKPSTVPMFDAERTR